MKKLLENATRELHEVRQAGREWRYLLEVRASELTETIINTDSRLISVDRGSRPYGAWEFRFFCNEYHFGKDFSSKLKSISKTTHDIDLEQEISDFEDEIKEVVYGFLYDNVEIYDDLNDEERDEWYLK